MRIAAILPALAGFLVLAGCEVPAPSLLSVDAVANEKDTAGDGALTGAWADGSEASSLCLIRAQTSGIYEITYFGAPTSFAFRGQLFRVKDAELIDITPSDDNDFRIPGHTVLRIWTSATALRWAVLDSPWLKEQTKDLASRETSRKLLLIAPPEAVRAFFAARAANEKAYEQIVTWQKIL